MHVHSARTTVDKVEEVLTEMLPPAGDRLIQGRRESYDDDLVDIKVHYLGGRDVLAVAVHHDHHSEPEPTSPRLVHVEEYGPDHRYFEAEGGAAMPPDTAGLVEDARRTWALWYGQDGRPTTLWLYRDASGAVIGDPIELLHSDLLERGVVAVGSFAGEVGDRIPARTVTIRRKDNGWDQFAFVDDDGRNVGTFVVDPRHVTVVHDRPTPPEWIASDLLPSAVLAQERLVEWIQKHPEIQGEGGAIDVVLRLLDHAYLPGGCEDPERLSAATPGRRW